MNGAPPAWALAAVVAAGGAVGSLARFGLGELLAGRTPGWPLATLLANLSGSLVIGWAAAALATRAPTPAGQLLTLFVSVGLCGGYTTFSAFSLQTVEMLRAGLPARALAYALISVAGCLAATAAGLVVGGVRPS